MGDSNILEFPVRRARGGGVLCAPLGIHFPVLYRATVTTTAKHIADCGLADDDEVTPGRWTHFDLEKTDGVLIGDVTWERATAITSDDRPESLLVRHHASLERAYGYLDAFGDFTLGGKEEYGRALYQTDEGVFTFTPRPTSPAWPGHLVLYLAQVPANNIFGSESWAHIVGPDGTALDVTTFGFYGGDGP